MATNNVPNSAYSGQPKERKLLLSKLFTDAPVRKEPAEAQKVIVAGLAEAQPQKEYPDTFFGRAWSVFRGELSLLFKASLFMVLFSLPLIILAVWFTEYFRQIYVGDNYIFMGDIGVGFPGGGDSISQSIAALIWNVKVPTVCMYAAAFIIASFGLSGIFYCAKRSYFQDVYKNPFKTYWMGFAKYWWKYVVCSTVITLIGTAMAVSVFHLLRLQNLDAVDAGAYCGVVSSFLFGAPMMLVPMVMMSLFASYELTFVQCFKNALVIIANSPVVVVITAVLSAVPLALLAINSVFVRSIDVIVMALLGATLMSLAWTALGDRGMVKCHNRKVATDAAEKQERLKALRAEQKNKPSQNNKKKQPVPYQNPKKKKKK